MYTHPRNTPYRAALVVAALALCVLVWLSLGVGIIGKDGDRANLMYVAVVLAGGVGAVASRLRPVGMARTLVAMAVIQALITAFALMRGLGLPWSGPTELVALNGFFIAVFASSAWLFRRAALAQSASPSPDPSISQ